MFNFLKHSILSAPKKFRFYDARYGVGVKALILSGFLYLSIVQSLWFIAVFLALAFYFYFRPTLNTKQFFYSFLVLIAAAVLFIFYGSSFVVSICLIFGLILFFMLGIKNMIFKHRSAIYHLVNASLFLMLFAFFFASDLFSLFLVKYLLLFSAVFVLFREFLNFSAPEALNSNKNNLISSGVAFLISQFVWVIALFPFYFLNASSLMLLTLLILEDFSVNYLSGTINRRIILRNITMFLVLSLVIFSASKWTP